MGQMRYSEKLDAWLRRAGWFPGRVADVDYEQLCRQQGHPVYPPAIAFLEEFGELEIPHMPLLPRWLGSWRNYKDDCPWEVGTPAVGLPPCQLESLFPKYGPLCPVVFRATCGGPGMMVDAEGRVYSDWLLSYHRLPKSMELVAESVDNLIPAMLHCR